jgi:prohibitin 1
MERVANLLSVAGAVVLGGGLLFKSFFYTVDAGYRAVIFNKLKGGISDTIVGEGMHFYVPGVYKPIICEVRAQPKTVTSITGTRDLQQIELSVRVLYRPIEDFLPSLINNVGSNYEEKILPSLVNEVVKSELARYDAIQILSNRDKISQDIRDQIVKRAQGFRLTLDDVSITHLAFGREFARAIEMKQVAQQEAERQKFIVQRNEEEKRATIIRSEAEAEAARLISEAVKINGDALVELRRIEAAKYIVDTLSKSPNITYIPNASGNLLNLKTF